MSWDKEPIEIETDHSLPVPEDIKTDIAIAKARLHIEEDSRATFKKNRRTNYVIFIGSAVAFVVVLGVVASLFTGGKNSKPVPIEAGLATGTDANNWNQVVELLRTYTPAETIAQVGTPQNLAANWLVAGVTGGSVTIPTTREYDTAFPFVQRYLLATFFYAMGGKDWTNNFHFLSTRDVCNWNAVIQDTAPPTFVAVESADGSIPDSLDLINGVKCNALGEVTTVWLPNNNLTGSIPPEAGLLEAMIKFAVYRNQISGALPSTLQYWADIKEFFVENNDLSGPIPSYIGQWTNLESASFSHNQFSGALSENVFAKLVNLQALALNDNQFTGSLDAFNNCTKLGVLFVENNKLTGAITASTLAGSNMRILNAGHNQMTGQLFSHFYYFDKFEINSNKIGGPLPAVDKDDYDIQFLSVYGNSMVGPIPDNIGSLASLSHVDLSNNGFTGTIPTTFDNLVELQYLYLSDNKFSPQEFPYLAGCTQLEEMALRNCNLNSSIPHWIGNHVDLVLLDVSNNKLTDVIPESMMRSTSLRFLLLANNMLNGTVPDSMANLRDLTILRVDHNPALNGTIGAVCADNGPTGLENVLADCNIICECCTHCCSSNDAKCGNDLATPNMDNMHERSTYVFSPTLIFDS